MAKRTMSQKLRDEASKAESSRALALRAGIDPASLRRFINAERSLRLDMADRLADALGFELRKVRKANVNTKGKG